MARSIIRLIADSERTEDVAVIEEIMGQTQLNYLLTSGALHTAAGKDLMRNRPEFSNIALDELRKLPAGSLGREFSEFLDRHGFKPLDYPTPFTADPDASYLLRRIRMSHDVWHVLMGWDTEEYEEVLVHSFSLAQTGLPSSIGICSVGAIKHMLFEGRWSVLTHDLRNAYQRGKEAHSLLPVYWERYWEHPISHIREKYGVVPL